MKRQQLRLFLCSVLCLIFAMAFVCPLQAQAAELNTAGASCTAIFQPADNSKLELFKARVYNGLIDLETEIDVSSIGITDSEIKDTNGYTGANATRNLIRFHPLFSTICITGSPELTYSGGTVSTVKVTYATYTWTQVLVDSFKARYASFTAEAPINANELQKALYVHDWICSNVSYGMSAGRADFALGAIVDGKAICAGYSYAYQFLAQQLGLECNYVTGTTKVEAHAWNKVKICGQWFLVDTTWDNSLAGTTNYSHTYCLLNDTEFAAAGDGSHNSDTDVTGNNPVNTSTSFANKYWAEVRGPVSADLYAIDPQLNCADHIWNSGSITKEPSDTEAGIKTYTCTACGTTKTETIPKTEPSPTTTPTSTPDPQPSAPETEIIPTLTAQGHVQTYGWQSTGPVEVGKIATIGTVGQSKRLEAVKLQFSFGSVLYRAHAQTYGWTNGWVSDGALAGTSGQSKRLEAIQIKLSGELAGKYDIYYRVHAQTYGWLGWAKNGEAAGTVNLSKRLEAYQVVLVEKGGVAPGSTDNHCVSGSPVYSTHVQTYGWQDQVKSPNLSGTSGQSKRLEAIKIALVGNEYTGSIRYSVHVQTYGWQDWKENGAVAGTSGESKRLEAIKIELTGEMAKHYKVQYRVHVQKYGWQDWVEDGAVAGTSGESLRLEAIQIRLVEK